MLGNDLTNSSDLAESDPASDPGTVSPYRFFASDRSEQFAPPILVDCRDDREASPVALGHATAICGFEVWLGVRPLDPVQVLICRVPPKKLPSR